MHFRLRKPYDTSFLDPLNSLDNSCSTRKKKREGEKEERVRRAFDALIGFGIGTREDVTDAGKSVRARCLLGIALLEVSEKTERAYLRYR